MIFTSLALAVLVTAAVFMRYIFRMDLYGIEEIEILIAMWLYFIGASYGSYTRTQISADIVESLFPDGKAKQVIRRVRVVVAVILYMGLTYLAVDLLDFNFTSHIRTAIWKIPAYFTSVGVLLGMILMTLYGIVEMREVFASPFQPNEDQNRAGSV